MPSHASTGLVLKEMSPDNLHMIDQVNRSELVHATYVAVPSPDRMSLTLERIEKAPPGQTPPWDAEGVASRIADWKPKIEKGGLLLGAFRGQRLVGFSAVGDLADDGSAELVALFVDSDHRRQGVGAMLMERTERLAKQKGIRALVIYSNPTASAVGFYLKRGCTPITLRSRAIVKHLIGDPVFAKEL